MDDVPDTKPVSGLAESSTCEWSVKPSSEKVGLALDIGKVVKVWDHINEAFEVTATNKATGEADPACAPTWIHTYDLPMRGVDFDP